MTAAKRIPKRECTGYVLHFFDAGLGQRGSDKFYIGFLYRSEEGLYCVMFAWGRDGTAGQISTQRFNDLKSAEALLDRKLAEKTRHGYTVLGRGSAFLEQHQLDVVQLEAVSEFRAAVTERDPDKNRMTGGYLIHEEPDLMDLLS